MDETWKAQNQNMVAIPMLNASAVATARSWHTQGGPTVAQASRRCSTNHPTSIAPATQAARTPRPGQGWIGMVPRSLVAWIASPAGTGPMASYRRCHVVLPATWARSGKR